MFKQACLGVIAVFALAWPAAAKDIPDGGLTLAEIVEWSQLQGFDAELKQADDGQSYLVGGQGGQRWEIWAYDCKEGRCTSVQVLAEYGATRKMTAQDYNGWNRDKRFARAYPDNQGNAELAYDIVLSPGGTWEAFEDHMAVWRQMSDEYWTFLNP